MTGQTDQPDDPDPGDSGSPPTGAEPDPGGDSALERSSRLRITLRQLEVFAATARAGSTRAAAERVARSQSAASTALADLERALGTALFDRVGRRLVLNEQGRALMPAVQALLDGAGEVQSLFAAGSKPPLRLAASFTVGEYLLPERIAAWSRRQPDQPLQMQIGNTRDVIAAVAALEVDVGFVEGPHADPDVLVHPWLDDELVIVAAADHALASRRVVSGEGLQAQRWALRERGSGTRQVADEWLLAHLDHLDVAFEMGSTEAIKQVVARTDAVTCVSRHAVSTELAAGSLVALRTRWPAATRRLGIALHRHRGLGRAATDFVVHCRDLGAKGRPMHQRRPG